MTSCRLSLHRDRPVVPTAPTLQGLLTSFFGPDSENAGWLPDSALPSLAPKTLKGGGGSPPPSQPGESWELEPATRMGHSVHLLGHGLMARGGGHLFCTMDPLCSLVKPMGLFSKISL